MDIYVYHIIIFLFLLDAIRKVLKDVANLFNPELIVYFGIFYIFVFMYYDIPSDILVYYMDIYYYRIALVYAILCMIVLRYSKRASERSVSLVRQHDEVIHYVPPNVLKYYISFVAIIAFAGLLIFASKSGGFVEFYSKPHGRAGRWDAASAYIHSLPQLLWGCMLMTYILWQRTGGKYMKMLFFMILAYLAWDTIIFGNRGGVIRFVFIIGMAYVFLHRPSFRKALPVFVYVLLAAIAVVAIPFFRDSTYIGAEKSLSESMHEFIAYYSGEKDTDSLAVGKEIATNVAFIQVASETQSFDFGMKYVYPIINFVPRAIWKSKPYRSEFGISYEKLVSRVTDLRLYNGSAVGAVAHTFTAFSWAGIWVWAILGYFYGRIFRKAQLAPTIMNLGHLAAMLVGSAYWITQSFTAFFYAWFFILAPFLGLKLLYLHFRSRRMRPAPLY